jgi:hypothetical protein
MLSSAVQTSGRLELPQSQLPEGAEVTLGQELKTLALEICKGTSNTPLRGTDIDNALRPALKELLKGVSKRWASRHDWTDFPGTGINLSEPGEWDLRQVQRQKKETELQNGREVLTRIVNDASTQWIEGASSFAELARWISEPQHASNPGRTCFPKRAAGTAYVTSYGLAFLALYRACERLVNQWSSREARGPSFQGLQFAPAILGILRDTPTSTTTWQELVAHGATSDQLLTCLQRTRQWSHDSSAQEGSPEKRSEGAVDDGEGTTDTNDAGGKRGDRNPVVRTLKESVNRNPKLSRQGGRAKKAVLRAALLCMARTKDPGVERSVLSILEDSPTAAEAVGQLNTLKLPARIAAPKKRRQQR